MRNVVLFLAVAGIGMLGLNLLDAPTLSDDMIYRFMWNGDETAAVQPVSSLSDLWQSQVNHYMTCNGRFVVHLLAQLFLVFVSPLVLQLLNSLLFVGLLWLCCRWNRRSPLFVAVMACFFLFVVFQGFRTTMVWSLGAFNYLWVLTAVMALLLWLRHINDDALTSRHFMLAPLALVAGWSHEALSLPLSVAFAFWMVVNRHRLRRAVTPYLLLFMAGTLLCMLSPGFWSRSTDGVGMVMRLVNGMVNMVFNVRIGWLLLVALFVLWKKKPTVFKTHLRDHFYGYIALAASLGIVFLCGTTLERVAFFTDFIAMLLLLSLLTEVLTAVWMKRLTIVACVLMVACYVPAWLVRRENSKNWLFAEQQMNSPQQEVIAVRQPLKGESPLMDYFRNHYVNPSIEFGTYCSYMGFDASDINMRCAARLYGKQRLVFLPEDVVERMANDSTAYQDYEPDLNKDLYVWRVDGDKQVSRVTFILNDEDPSQLMLHQRLMAYAGNSYELDDYHYEVVGVASRRWLVFTRPTTNIYRRINHVEYE